MTDLNDMSSLWIIERLKEFSRGTGNEIERELFKAAINRIEELEKEKYVYIHNHIAALNNGIKELEEEICRLHNPHSGEECDCNVCQIVRGRS